jgi:hypothetical protein
MFAGSLRRFTVLLAIALPVALTTVGCGPGANEPKVANVKPGSMPEGGEWQGVYYNAHYGHLHMLADGDSVSGAWKTPMGSFGELHGKTEGNLLKYEWSERRIGAVGKDAKKSGKGYFLYLEPKAGEAHEIHGEWGEGDSEAGNSWEAVKQKNVPPDLDSQRPDEYEGQVSGGGWDDEKKGDAPASNGDDEVTAPE